MKSRSTRNTRQRSAIESVFERSERPLSVDEVHAASGRGEKRVGIATVYRSINALIDEGWLDAVAIAGEPTRYERAGKEHHHHFQCEGCNRTFDVAGCVRNIAKLAPPDFVVREHAVTLYGLCARCCAG